MSRRRSSDFEAMVVAAARLPWWLGLIAAVISYFALNRLSLIDVPPASSMADASNGILLIFVRTAGLVGQYLLPAIFVLGSIGSIFGQLYRGNLIRKAARDPRAMIENMSWRDFEELVAEAYRRKGYAVRLTGGGGADGGVDLELGRDGERIFVQCKQWKAQKVGIRIVRELYGVVVAEGASSGIIVSAGDFTADAARFAEDNQITLITGDALRRIIDGSAASMAGSGIVLKPSISGGEPPLCPLCGAILVKRQARRGAGKGQDFWGCSTYPKCRGTRPIDA